MRINGIIKTVVCYSLIFSLIWMLGVPKNTAAANINIKEINNTEIILEDIYWEADGTLVERGRFGNIQVESHTKENSITTTIISDSITEVIKVDTKSPFFTITTNGETREYDRRDYITYDKEHNYPLIKENLACGEAEKYYVNDTFTIQAVVDPSQFFGHMYFNYWLATMNSWDPYFASAMCYENYTYYLDNYANYLLESWILFSLAIGIIGIGFSNLYSIISSVVTIVSGVLYVASSVNVEKRDYVRYNTRFSRISQDPNNGIWCIAGRTRWSYIAGSINGIVANDYSDNQHAWYSFPQTINSNALTAWYMR